MVTMRVLIVAILLITFKSFDCSTIQPDQICNKEVAYIFTESTGDIYSPNYLSNHSYPEGLECKWSILIPAGQYLRLKFEDLDIDESLQCEDDSLSFYVSSTGVKFLYKRVCGSWKPQEFVLSQFSLLEIEFISDYIYSGRGFHLSWTIEKALPTCEKREFKCQSSECVPIAARCNGKFECDDGSDELKCPNQKLPQYECGKQAIKPDLSGFTDRILGGDAVIPGSWPWQADLQLDLVWPSGHYCGGALIHPQYVLTAAHCIAANNQAENIRIVLGNHGSYKKDEVEQVRTVEEITVYDDGSSVNQDFDHRNDFAILKLTVPVAITDAVNPVCLADPSKQLKQGTKCYVTGWGSTRGTGNSEALKQVIVEVDDINSCSKAMTESEEDVDTSGDSQICIKVGGHGTGVCSGDSGGPLACQIDEKWYLFGIASMVTSGTVLGPVCGDGGGNAVYGNVRAHVKWIKDIIAK